MRRSHFHPAACKRCGAHSDDGFHISQQGLCVACSKERFEENFDAMKSMQGPFALHWRQRMAAAVGAVLLDAAPPLGDTGGHAD